jgi:tetratricopeptide (TPR) repeat protein
MESKRNRALEAWMREHGHSSNTLAEAVNEAIEKITGRPGGLDGSSVRAWKRGQVRWPKTITRRALEEVTGIPATALGFSPRARVRSAELRSHQEDPLVKRRTLGGVAVAAAVAAASPGVAAPRRIGMSDVNRLQARFAEIIASDHRKGGVQTVERQAAALAQEAINLQSAGSSTERVRSSLYACAASFRSSAMWAAIDGRRYDDAAVHMREAQALAEMSGDQAIKFRIWSHAGSMYRHMGRPADALAANNVARSLHINRRDPIFASLGLARQGAIQGVAQERAGARRAFAEAEDAMVRADPGESRPVWLLAFYDEAELNSLALSAYLSLGEYETAEAHAHRCLAGLRPHMHRSRAIATTRLAHAQLAQGDADAATATAMAVPAEAATQHPRVSRMLAEFGAALRAIAPRSLTVQTWTEHTRDAWRTPA